MNKAIFNILSSIPSWPGPKILKLIFTIFLLQIQIKRERIYFCLRGLKKQHYTVTHSSIYICIDNGNSEELKRLHLH